MADNQGGVNGNDQDIPNGPRRYTDVERTNFIAALNMRDALEATAEGQAILTLYDEANSKELPNPVINRRLVYRIVGDAAMAVKPDIETKEIHSLAKKISDFFKNELVETYFDQVNGKYYGILYYYIKNKKNKIKNIRKSNSLNNEEEIIDDPDEIASKLFLDTNVDPLDEVVAAWKKTINMRKRQLFDTHDQPKKKKKQDNNTDNNETVLKIGQFLNAWSSLKAPYGHQLVELDFAAWFPEASQLTTEKLAGLLEKLFLRLQSTKKNQRQIRWISEIEEMQEEINSADTSDNEKIVNQIRLIAYLLPPTGRGSPTDKTSVIDVIDSILIFVDDNDNAVQRALAERQTELMKRKKKLQPLLVIVGEYEGIFCCVYDVVWKVENVLKGFDILFKSFFTLDLNFPYQSITQYEVLQHYIYEIVSKPIHPKARTVISDLQQIVD